MGLPDLSVTNPERPEVVTPWANIEFANMRVRAIATDQMQLLDHFFSFIGL